MQDKRTSSIQRNKQELKITSYVKTEKPRDALSQCKFIRIGIKKTKDGSQPDHFFRCCLLDEEFKFISTKPSFFDSCSTQFKWSFTDPQISQDELESRRRTVINSLRGVDNDTYEYIQSIFDLNIGLFDLNKDLYSGVRELNNYFNEKGIKVFLTKELKQENKMDIEQ